MASKYKKSSGKMLANGRARTNSFVLVTHALFDSESWRRMSPLARALYTEIRRRYNGYNNGEIGLSCRKAADALNCSKNTACKAFIELVLHGFVRAAKEASFAERFAREWTLTCEPTFGSGPTNEWKEWPSIKFEYEYLVRAQEKHLKKLLLRKKKRVPKNDSSVPKNDTDDPSDNSSL